LGLNVRAALFSVTRDVTRRAAVIGSIDDENTILCASDNAKLLEGNRDVLRQSEITVKDSFAHFSFAQHRLPVDVTSFPAFLISKFLGIRGRD
jgi:hypothetical protein